jgi:hypothetical protein
MFKEAPPSAGAVRALAHQLLTWADHLSTLPAVSRELSEEDRHELIVRLALATREACRLRSAIFPGAAFTNPVWEVMRDLFIQEMSGFRTSLDNMALAGALPAATVHECVDELARIGLLERSPDRFDGRVEWLSLSVRGRQGMFDLFERSSDFVVPGPRRVSDETREAIA